MVRCLSTVPGTTDADHAPDSLAILDVVMKPDQVERQTPQCVDSKASDQSLVRRIQNGNQEAATELYERYATRLIDLIKMQTSSALKQRVDPEDMLQSVFRNFFDQIQHQKYSVPPSKELWKFLMVIALNKVRTVAKFNQAQKRDIRRSTSIAGTEEIPALRRQSTELITRLTIAESLEKLPEKHRAVVQLRLDGYEVLEIAERIQRSARTVERLLQESRILLREMITEDEHE